VPCQKAFLVILTIFVFLVFYFLFFYLAWTFIAGVIAVVSVISLGLAALLGVCLLLMLKTQERVCLPYRPAVVARLVLSALAGM
jgi:hypothetical protein